MVDLLKLEEWAQSPDIKESTLEDKVVESKDQIVEVITADKEKEKEKNRINKNSHQD